MPKLQPVRGMRDFLPSDAEKLRFVEARARDIARLYGFEEVITPLVEQYDLLAAKSGKEIKARMYAFKDLGGRKVALRPEFTASIARLMATTLRNTPHPLRLFSSGSLYRYDEPQFGRYREFWQSNFETIGSSKPEADVEILDLTNRFMQKLGLREYWFKIGHVGILRGVLSEEGISDDQQNRLMHLLDTERWDEAVNAAEKLGVSKRGITTLKELLKAKGKPASRIWTRVETSLKKYAGAIQALENLEQIMTLCNASSIKFNAIIEPGFARGLEYYTGMIFEILVPEIDVSLGGGGRYDKLVELFDGQPTPAVGVAQGLDRITLAMDEQQATPKFDKQLVAVIPIEEETIAKAFDITAQLRKNGVATMMEVMGRKVARALQDANRREATYAIIIGPKELKEGKVVLRNMKHHQQSLIPIKDVATTLSARARKSD